MSSVSSKPAGEAPPVFSYAQAAKGRVASTTATAIQSSQTTTSGISTPGKDTNSSVNTPYGGSERGDRSVNGSYDSANKADTTGESSNSEPAVAKTASSAASPSFGSASTCTPPKEEKIDDFTLVGGLVSDRSARGESIPDKNSEGNEGRRSKRSKKQKNADKEAEKEREQEKEEAKQEILVPAPLPTVNFWQQRKEELAKIKPSSMATQSSQLLSNAPLSSDPLLAQNAKVTDAKKRAKTNGSEEAGKISDLALSQPLKDIVNTGKGQKKVNDSNGKVKEDQSGKRSGPRGSRVPQKDEIFMTNQLPPPVDDAISWPTPETAIEEEKRKAQEKGEKEEKDEGVSNKPRPKEKWVQMPYIPSVTFNTPMPTRGGRGRGGARGGRTEANGRPSHTVNGGAPGDKATSTSTGTTAELERSTGARETAQHPRSNSLPPTPSKRQQNEQQASLRKPLNAQSVEKSKAGQAKGESNGSTDSRPTAGFSQQDPFVQAHHDQQLQRGDTNRGSKADQSQGNFTEGHSHPRSGATDRRSEPNLRGNEQFKDGATLNKDNHQTRERSDARLDRGRGGFRGRGGHNNFANGQSQAPYMNGHGSQAQNGFPIRQNSVPYNSPPLPPQAFHTQYVAPPPRNGRSGSRSQSISNAGMYGRFPPNGAPLTQHMASVQTSNPMFDYHHLSSQSMSAGPYTSYIDHASVVAMVAMQFEYYFSIDNLCKDVYMRKHMDSQGFVFLSFIAGFKRIQALTQDYEVLRQACQDSTTIELVRGNDDGFDRLRRKDGWEKWVLAMEERDEKSRNSGPATYFSPLPQRGAHLGGGITSNQQVTPPAFSPNGTESSFRPYGNSGTVAPVLNGNSNPYHPETPLSAAVPDFAPSALPSNGAIGLLEAETTFLNEEVQFLTLVFQPQGTKESKAKTPYHTSSARTFSNGSIDGRSISEDLHDDVRQGRGLTDGSHATEASPDDLHRSRSPLAPTSPTKASFNNSPTVMWVKGQGHQVPVSELNSRELYTSFRSRALKRREGSAPGETHPDMKLLYEFWSHFLCRNFNTSMYLEFQRCAYEDSRSSSTVGIHNLLSYYDEVLNSKKKVISEALAADYVDLVRREQINDSEHRPAFEKLRAAWRNGALDMKSRKKIDNFVDAKLRQELEQAPHAKVDLA